MKIMTKIALGTAALLLVAAAQPALAQCGGAPILSTNGGPGLQSFLVTEGQPAAAFTGYSDNTSCFTFGCYAPAVINPAGFFWGQGDGDVAFGVGVDNGTFDVDRWANNAAAPYGPQLFPNDFAGGGTYFYMTYVNTTWAQGGQDGCPLTDGDVENQCTCMVLTDQSGDTVNTWFGGPAGDIGQDTDGKGGYVAVLGNAANSSGDTFLNRPGGAPIVLLPIGAPQIIDTQRNGVNFNLDLVRVNYNFPAGADYTQGPCECAPTNYLVYEWQETQPGNTDTRNPGGGNWALLAGQPAGGTPIGTPVDVASACGVVGGTKDVFISARLLFGIAPAKVYENAWLGTDSTRIECGEFYTEPEAVKPPRVRQNRKLNTSRGTR